jgi:hypothetical protein
MNDLLKAYQTNFAKKKKEMFKIEYRSKKSESESIVIRASDWYGAGVFFPTIFGRKPIKSAEPLPEILNYDCRLQRTRLGKFYFCLLFPLEIRGDNQTPQWTNNEDGIIALDPGVRTFMTGNF